MRFTLAAAATAMLLAGPALAESPQPSPTAEAAPATLAHSRQFDFTSEVNGKRYRVQVALPFAPPPPGGYPVLYVLDGDAYFGSFAAAARLRSALGGEVGPAIVVGIGYPDADLPSLMRSRSRDLTPFPADAIQAARDTAAFGAPLAYGEADALLKVLRTEVKPRVAASLPVDDGREILFGHSLGGLFALHVLFTQADAFDTYLVLSPSVWWGDRRLLAEEAAFSKTPARARVFVGVGSLEQTVPDRLPAGFDAASARALIDRTRMVDDAKGIGERLSSLPTLRGRVDMRILDGQSHNSAPWTAINPMLDFALGHDHAR